MRKKIKQLINKIEQFVRKIFRIILFIGEWISIERKATVRLNFKKKINAWRHGFYSESYATFFSDNTHNYKDYLSDYQQSLNMPKINQKHGILLADKTVFYNYMRPFHQYVPEIYGVVNKGKFQSGHQYKISTFSDLKDIILEQKAIVIKPVSDYGGHGVVVCKILLENLFINEQLSTFSDLEDIILKSVNYMVVKYIQQHGYAKNIFPQTTNTIRILTMLDQNSGEVFIADIFHRFGTLKSIPVDNWAQGGIVTFIDENTGILGESLYRTTDKKLLRIDKHPDNESHIKGVKLPNWELVKNSVLEMARYFHHCPYIGWDVVIQETGFYIIEGNDCPNVTQLYNPLLSNPKVKKFYKEYGVVK